MNHFPDQSAPPEQPSHIHESRRRRTRPLNIPSGRTERSLYVNEIAKRLVPSLDFYLFSALCGLILAAAILIDHPTIFVLAALLAPFMAPLIGLGFSTAVGSFKFFVQSLGSLAIGSVFVFIGGVLSGWLSKLIPGFTSTQARFHTTFSVPDLILLLIGTVLAIYLTVRVPKQRSLVASVALAYEVYLPIGVAGFGLTGGTPDLLVPAIRLAGIHILLVIVMGAIVLAFMRLRPFTFFGYLLTAILLGGAVYALVMSGAIKASLQGQRPASTLTQTIQDTQNLPIIPTGTPKPKNPIIPNPLQVTATNTLVPTFTPTVTNTPKPVEVWAVINVDVGVYVRENPCLKDDECPKIHPPVPFNTPVLVLPEESFSDNIHWILIHVDEGNIEGWISRDYLTFDNQ